MKKILTLLIALAFSAGLFATDILEGKDLNQIKEELTLDVMLGLITVEQAIDTIAILEDMQQPEGEQNGI